MIKINKKQLAQLFDDTYAGTINNTKLGKDEYQVIFYGLTDKQKTIIDHVMLRIMQAKSIY